MIFTAIRHIIWTVILSKMKQIIVFVICMFFLGITGLHSQPVKGDHFQVGATWLDTNGDTINAHGGNIIYYKKHYYWF